MLFFLTNLGICLFRVFVFILLVSSIYIYSFCWIWGSATSSRFRKVWILRFGVSTRADPYYSRVNFPQTRESPHISWSGIRNGVNAFTPFLDRKMIRFLDRNMLAARIGTTLRSTRRVRACSGYRAGIRSVRRENPQVVLSWWSWGRRPLTLCELSYLLIVQQFVLWYSIVQYSIS